jgi:hypothetical protein
MVRRGTRRKKRWWNYVNFKTNSMIIRSSDTHDYFSKLPCRKEETPWILIWTRKVWTMTIYSAGGRRIRKNSSTQPYDLIWLYQVIWVWRDVVRIARSDCIRRMLTRRTRSTHVEAWKQAGRSSCRNAGMNINVRACVKEREVKESVRIELVKALRQARFILTERDIARSGFITTYCWTVI